MNLLVFFFERNEFIDELKYGCTNMKNIIFLSSNNLLKVVKSKGIL